MHRVVAGTKKGEFTDHRDLDKLNNQEHNLRPATKQLNAVNTKKQANRSSQYKGVSKCGKGWRTQIWQNNAKVFDTTCPSERWAGMIYDLNAPALFGEYARLNFSESILIVQE